MRFILLLITLTGLLSDQVSANSKDSLGELIEGNRRYVQGKTLNPSKTLKEKRKELLSTQHPFATILSCSDSRVPPEIIFDQSLGDLFVVRVAGNIVGPTETDSIEYAADELHVPLVLVLGHQGCGAVKAFLSGPINPDLVDIAPQIQEAVRESKDLPGNPWMNAVKANVNLSVEKLQENPVLKKLIEKGELEIRGGYYELETGQVRLLP